MMLFVFAPLAAAAVLGVVLARRKQSRTIGIGVLACCVSFALFAGAYSAGKDMARRDATLQTAQADTSR